MLTERVHAQKVILIDEQCAGVGTMNLDNRSLHINFEVTAVLFDATRIVEIEAMLKPTLTAVTCMNRKITISVASLS